jgi:two-component system response regulator HydG
VSENRSLRQELSQLKHRTIVGSSEILRRALSVAAQAAPSTANVLILGESGTGKELIARHVHAQSGRKGDFIAVNLSALPESIVESEIFGHEKGAFTGAMARREGRIAQARGGTLFLDEIGELAPQVQVKLLRILQEGEYEPLGGRTEKADFRLVAATHRDLAKEVASGRFREDLFYRLNVIAITCPPLRKRREDIPLLVDHFVDTYSRKNGRPALRITREAMDRLSGYDWPGNVRELENVIERAVVLSTDGPLREADLPEPIAAATPREATLSFTIGTPLEQIERRVIHATLEHTQGDKRLAAQLLGIATRTIYRKLDSDRTEDDTEATQPDHDDKMA